jgi:hypothetical protein
MAPRPGHRQSECWLPSIGTPPTLVKTKINGLGEYLPTFETGAMSAIASISKLKSGEVHGPSFAVYAAVGGDQNMVTRTKAALTFALDAKSCRTAEEQHPFVMHVTMWLIRRRRVAETIRLSRSLAQVLRRKFRRLRRRLSSKRLITSRASSLGHDCHARSYGVNAKRSQPAEELQDGRSRNAPKDHSQWNSLPKDKRQTAEQATAFARKAVEENELQRSHGAFRSAANTNDQAMGRRFWKYLSIAKQATAAKRCLSVCPLRMKLR